MITEMEFEGLDVAISNLQGIAPALAADIVGVGLRAGANEVARKARQLVPVREGNLRKTIRARRASQIIDTSTGRKKISGAAAVVLAGSQRSQDITGGAHAVLVEYGTVNSPAKPFLEPAAQANPSQVLKAASEASQKALRNMAARVAAPPDSPGRLLPTVRMRRLAAL